MAIDFAVLLTRAEKAGLPILDRLAQIGLYYSVLKRSLETYDAPGQAGAVALDLLQTLIREDKLDTMLLARVPALDEVIAQSEPQEHPLPLGQKGENDHPFEVLKNMMAQTQQALDKDEGESVTQVGSGPNVVWRSDEEIAAAESEAEERGPFAFSGWGSNPNGQEE